MWQMAVQAAIKAGGNYLAGRQEARQLEQQNKRIDEANLKNALETVEEISSLSVQNLFIRDQAARLRSQVSRSAMLGAAGYEANAAAAGVVGGSVDAVMNDIERELQQARAEQAISQEMQQYNLNQSLRSLMSASKANVQRRIPVPSRTETFHWASIAAWSDVGQNYAQNYFNFGGGGGQGGGSSVAGRIQNQYTGAQFNSWVAAQRGG